MKKIILFLLFVLPIAGNLQAQKFGFIDSEYILSKMPEYKEARASLDRMSAGWQTEIQNMQKSADRLRADFEAEKVMYTDAMQKQKLTGIRAEEEKVRNRQNEIFGFDGLLFKKRDELLKPLQDKIFAVTQQIARKRKLNFIFDRSDVMIIYADPTHDYTDSVLEELMPSDKSK